MVKAVLFDLDGTLVDSEEKIKNDFVQAFAAFGEVFDKSIMRLGTARASFSADRLVELKRAKSLKEHGRDLTSDEISALRAQFIVLFERIFSDWTEAIKQKTVQLFPETIDVLEKLKKTGFKMLVVSRSTAEAARAKIVGLGLSSYFPKQYVVPIAQKRELRSRTKSFGYLEALSEEALAAGFASAANAAGTVSHLFIIGDRTEDMLAGEAIRRWAAKKPMYKNTKIVTILVNRTGASSSKYSDVAVKDLREALEVIERAA
jgi:phosphoglycolate phosphatase-like HAD superfamily hydrolase